MTFIDDIRAFHEKFKLEYNDDVRRLPQELHDFRWKFMYEELKEYNDAYNENDLPKQLDALVDLMYVLLGTAYLHGFLEIYPQSSGVTLFEEAWRRVQAANMAKVRAERASDSTRGSTLDVVKPIGWQAPDLTDLV